jgi:hypothetical protein
MIATTARRRRKGVVPIPTVTAQAGTKGQSPKAKEPKPYVPSPEFQRAYANPHNEIGPIATRWSERGIAEWLLPVNSERRGVGRDYHRPF